MVSCRGPRPIRSRLKEGRGHPADELEGGGEGAQKEGLGQYWAVDSNSAPKGAKGCLTFPSSDCSPSPTMVMGTPPPSPRGSGAVA